jgi:hypothetical protein
VFLATMQQIVPWEQLCGVIEPFCPKLGNGRPPVGLERMLRMHFIQHWFNLADAACEDALLDSSALRRFVGIDLGRERVPDATTLLKFRRLLEKHKLGEALFAKVGEVLQAQRLKGSATEGLERLVNRAKSRVRSRVEHVFAVVKRLWSFNKVRYRGLLKTRPGRSWPRGWPTSSLRDGISRHECARDARKAGQLPKCVASIDFSFGRQVLLSSFQGCRHGSLGIGDLKRSLKCCALSLGRMPPCGWDFLSAMIPEPTTAVDAYTGGLRLEEARRPRSRTPLGSPRRS